MNFLKQAEKKLTDECKNGQFGAKERAMKGAVKDALLCFARQDDEFAQAIAQGGSFTQCMAAVAQGVGSAISDVEAYKKAVQFYFEGAEVTVQMRIDVCPNRAEAPTTKLLNLEDFL